MNCRWRELRLRGVLFRAAPSVQKGHVAFACNRAEAQEDTCYGGSIELE
jgi:hypothetical protein